MPRRPVTKPRQAMSARQLDRTENGLQRLLAHLAVLRIDLDETEKHVRDLILSLRRSERR